MLTAAFAASLLAVSLGGWAGYSAARRRCASAFLADRIDAILPQTQCEQCGYPGCRPYAEALAARQADINQCPPGGDEGIRKLAALLGVKPKPLNPAHGPPKPKAAACIDEALCIGCTLCIQACPVDAIVGAAQQMHTVIARECTGCELCVAPCPVDCIAMTPIREDIAAWTWGNVRANRLSLRAWARFVEAKIRVRKKTQAAADLARQRHRFRLARLEREKAERTAKLARKLEIKLSEKLGTLGPGGISADPKRAAIAAAMERAQRQRAAATPVEHRSNE